MFMLLDFPEGFIKPRRVPRVQMSGRLRQRQLVILSTLLFCVSALQAHAAIVTVTNTNDNGPGSLRQVLMTANDGDTINFAVTRTVTLTSDGLPINKNITILGPDADQLSVNGNQPSRDQRGPCSTACSAVALTLVQSRRNRGRGA